MDPENVAMRLRLADVYVRLNKKDQARQVYSAAAETLRAKGQLDAAEEVLQKLVKLDPGSSEAVVLRARNAMETGDYSSAAQQLGKIKNIEANPEAMRGLFHSYLHLGKLPEAGALAPKLFAAQSEITRSANMSMRSPVRDNSRTRWRNIRPTATACYRRTRQNS